MCHGRRFAIGPPIKRVINVPSAKVVVVKFIYSPSDYVNI